MVRHCGPHPEDAVLLGGENLMTLRLAAGELAWLLARGYPAGSSLKLVGDRYQLRKRQRLALARAVAAPQTADRRRRKRVGPEALRGQRLWVDALNQIITIETALSGGLLLRGHDGALRDLSSVHGAYRTLRKTHLALESAGILLEPLGLLEVVFLIDSAVSRSGQLAELIVQISEKRGWPWSARLVLSADPFLKRCPHVVSTSDSTILDRVDRWFDLADAVVGKIAPGARCVRLDTPPPIVP